MKNIKIYNKKSVEIFQAILQEDKISSWLEIIGEAKGKPERWVRAKELMQNGDPNEPEHWMWHSEYYEDSDIKEFQTRSTDSGEIETWVLLKADYLIEIIDLDKDYDYLLQQCYENRKREYPPITDLADALLKKELGDDSKYIEYINRCEAVKTKYPKPIKEDL